MNLTRGGLRVGAAKLLERGFPFHGFWLSWVSPHETDELSASAHCKFGFGSVAQKQNGPVELTSCFRDARRKCRGADPYPVYLDQAGQRRIAGWVAINGKSPSARPQFSSVGAPQAPFSDCTPDASYACLLVS